MCNFFRAKARFTSFGLKIRAGYLRCQEYISHENDNESGNRIKK